MVGNGVRDYWVLRGGVAERIEVKPTAARLRELFDYDPLTGALTWRVRRGTAKAGDVAGSITNGYLQVQIYGKNYYVHRVIWCMQTGAWPSGLIDHMDLNGVNNVWTNLREATPSQNRMNTHTMSNNKIGKKGVHFDRGKFRARIMVDGNIKHLGRFNTVESASAAYSRAAMEWHGDFARVD